MKYLSYETIASNKQTRTRKRIIPGQSFESERFLNFIEYFSSISTKQKHANNIQDKMLTKLSFWFFFQFQVVSATKMDIVIYNKSNVVILLSLPSVKIRF